MYPAKKTKSSNMDAHRARALSVLKPLLGGKQREEELELEYGEAAAAVRDGRNLFWG